MVLVVILDDRPRHKAATCTTLKWIDIRTKQIHKIAYNLNNYTVDCEIFVVKIFSSTTFPTKIKHAKYLVSRASPL